MGTLVKIEGQQVIVGFPKKASVACSRIQKEETRTLIARICQDVVGATIHMRVVELAEDPGEGGTMKQMRAQRQQQDDETLLREARANPLVKHAMDLFWRRSGEGESRAGTEGGVSVSKNPFGNMGNLLKQAKPCRRN